MFHNFIYLPYSRLISEVVLFRRSSYFKLFFWNLVLKPRSSYFRSRPIFETLRYSRMLREKSIGHRIQNFFIVKCTIGCNLHCNFLPFLNIANSRDLNGNNGIFHKKCLKQNGFCVSIVKKRNVAMIYYNFWQILPYILGIL